MFFPRYLSQSAAVSRQQNGDGIRHQQQPSCDVSGSAVQPRIADTGRFEVNVVNHLVQRDVGVKAVKARQQRDANAGKGLEGLIPKSCKAQVEPHDVRFKGVDVAQQPGRVTERVEGPAADHAEVFQFRLGSGELIGQNGNTGERILAQLACNVISVLTDPLPTRWKCTDQANFHQDPNFKNALTESLPRSEK